MWDLKSYNRNYTYIFLLGFSFQMWDLKLLPRADSIFVDLGFSFQMWDLKIALSGIFNVFVCVLAFKCGI